MKQQIQLSLDAEVIRQLRKKNINISALVNNLLWNVVRQEAAHAEEIALTMLQNDRQRLLESLRRAEEAVERTKQFIAEVDEKIEKQKVVIQEVRKSERIAALMRELNEQIANANYNFDHVKESETLKKLANEGVPVSEAWLKRHIARIELLGK